MMVMVVMGEIEIVVVVVISEVIRGEGEGDYHLWW